MRKHAHEPVKDRKLLDGTVERRCRDCRAWMVLTRHFEPNKLGRAGFLGHCHMCRSEKRLLNGNKAPAKKRERPSRKERPLTDIQRIARNERKRSRYLQMRLDGKTVQEAQRAS